MAIAAAEGSTPCQEVTSVLAARKLAIAEALSAQFASELQKLSPSWQVAVDGPAKRKVDATEVIGVSGPVLGAMLAGRCRDQRVPVTAERQRRFAESLCSQCSSSWFTYNDAGIGAEGARAIGATLLLNDRYTSLSLSSNALGDAGAVAVAEMLREHETLVHLDLSACGIQTSGADALLESLLTNRSLTHLDLSSKTHGARNRIDRRNSIALERALASNPVLAKLCMCGVSLGADGTIGVARGLTLNRALLVLDLSNNDIGTRGALLLTEAVPCSFLEELNISDNKIGDEGLLAFGKMLGILPKSPEASLESDVWGSTPEEIHGATHRYFAALRELPHALREVPWSTAEEGCGPRREKALKRTVSLLAEVFDGLGAASLPRSPKLRSLTLANTGGSSAGVEGVEDALRANTVLDKLALDGCGHKTLESVMVMLPINSTLKALSLADCRLSSAGVIDICKALSLNRGVESLSLRGNQMGPEAANAISQVLAGAAPKLRSLNLSSCFLEDAEGAMIARGLAQNGGLEVLLLRNNSFHDVTAKAFIDALNSNNTLTQLSLEQNTIEVRLIDQVKKLLDRNAELRKRGLQEQYGRRVEELVACKKEVDLLAATLANNQKAKYQARLRQAAALQELRDARETEAKRQKELEATLSDIRASQQQVDQELAQAQDKLTEVRQDGDYEASQRLASIEGVQSRIAQTQKQLKSLRKQLQAFEETAGEELSQLRQELGSAERARDGASSLASAAQHNLDAFAVSLKAIEGDIAGGANPRQRRVEIQKAPKAAKSEPSS